MTEKELRPRSEAKRRPKTRKKVSREDEPAPAREWLIDVPNDPINEMVVLGSILVDEATADEYLPKCPPDAFYAKAHHRIRTVVGKARQKGLALDPATLARLDPEIDVVLIEKLRAARPDVPENIKWHVESLLYDFHRAQVTQGPLSSLIDAIQDPTTERDRLASLGRQLSKALETKAGGGHRFIRDTKQVIAESMASLRHRAQGNAFYPFGINGLDYDENGRRRVRPGAMPGLITLLTGTSGSGKTTMSGHIILGRVKQKKRQLIGAWEVRAPMTMELLAVISLGWSRAQILDGKSNEILDNAITDEEMEIIEARMHELAPYIVFVDNPYQRGNGTRASNEQHLDVIEEVIISSGADDVTLDLFDRCLVDRMPDAEQEALWQMVEIVDRCQVHMLMVHQQLMKGDTVRADMRPTIGNIKGSSAYIDAASLILAPYMPSRHKDVDEVTMELLGLKQRFGPTFAIEFGWDPDTAALSGGRSFNPRELEASDETVAPRSFGRGQGSGKKRRQRD